MAIWNLKEWSVNKDDNGIEMYLGGSIDVHVVDLTGNGDYLKVAEYDNGVYAVEDELQTNHTHFTEDIEVTLESYIEQEERP